MNCLHNLSIVGHPKLLLWQMSAISMDGQARCQYLKKCWLFWTQLTWPAPNLGLRSSWEQVLGRTVHQPKLHKNAKEELLHCSVSRPSWWHTPWSDWVFHSIGQSWLCSSVSFGTSTEEPTATICWSLVRCGTTVSTVYAFQGLNLKSKGWLVKQCSDTV